MRIVRASPHPVRKAAPPGWVPFSAAEERVYRKVRAAFRALTASASADHLREAVRLGSPDAVLGAFDAAAWAKAVGGIIDTLEATWLDSLRATWDTTPLIRKGGLPKEMFRQVNPFSFRTRRLTDLTKLFDFAARTAEIADQLRETLQMRRDFPSLVDAVATELARTSPVDGLTPARYRSIMKRAAAMADAGSAPAVIERWVRSEAERAVRIRAAVIARTETVHALQEGKLDAWREARNKRLIPPEILRRWSTAHDERTCPICAPMDGQTRGLEEPFESPSDGSTALTPPIHPQCRCDVDLVIPSPEEEAAYLATRKAAPPSPALPAVQSEEELIEWLIEKGETMPAFLQSEAVRSCRDRPPWLSALLRR